MSQAENHQWLQSIHYLRNMHGFSDTWNNPSVPGDTFHKAFKLRADDQLEISDNRGHDSYIHIIRSPRIRNTNNILSSCPLCSREPETVKHFILKYCRFADEREKLIDSIT